MAGISSKLLGFIGSDLAPLQNIVNRTVGSDLAPLQIMAWESYMWAYLTLCLYYGCLGMCFKYPAKKACKYHVSI